jgi:hypothetical protein
VVSPQAARSLRRAGLQAWWNGNIDLTLGRRASAQANLKLSLERLVDAFFGGQMWQP